MEALISYLLQFGNLNGQQVDLIRSKAMEVQLRKEDYFSEAGKIARQVSFILDGILRVCYYNNSGEDVTMYFIDENNFVVDLDSFDNQVPSAGYVQAVLNCTLIVFSRKDWQDLGDTIVGWESIISKVSKKALLQKIERRSPLVAEDASTRYTAFMEKYPGMVNRVPLGYLASYLGVTPSSLSRIRKGLR